ncbi:MAG: heavy-metal-associated domain-containing protein [Clostridia bacterium]|nr:heavy-metal-associated domain-containing protein [Clostridia bacterium]
MENVIIIAILVVVIAVAVLRARKHFKGGGCCGSGSNTIRSKKELTEPKLGEKILTVEGMHCENCQARVENILNRMDGVACRVNLKKKTAVVSYSTEVSDEVLKEAVEKLGYSVTEIR